MNAAPDSLGRERAAPEDMRIPGPGGASAAAPPPVPAFPVASDPLCVLVLDEAGRPVAGATLSLEARQVALDDSAQLGAVPGLLDPIEGVTGDDGEAFFAGLADVAYRLGVVRAGAVVRAGLEARPGQDVIVTLRSGRELKGQILDAEHGTPVAGALVRVSGADWNRREETRGVSVTDAAGRFAIGGVGDGGFGISVKAAWYPGFQLELPEGAPGPVVLLHRAPRGIAGRIMDRASGAPVSDASVRGPGAETVSGPDGGFLLCGVTLDESALPGEAVEVPIEVEHPAFRLKVLPVPVPVAPPEGTALATDLGEFALDPRPAVLGIVRDGAGVPVEGALVVLAPPGSNLAQPGVLRPLLRTRTGPGGAFHFPSGPVDGGRLDIVVFAPSHAVGFLAVDGSRRQEVEIVLDAGVEVSLVVPGTAEAGRAIVLEERAAGATGPATVLRRRPSVTAAGGRIEFSGVRPGPIRILIPGVGLMDLEVGANGLQS